MTTTTPRRFRGGAVLLCTAGLVSGGLATALPAAAATSLGTLTFSPDAGLDISSIQAYTHSTSAADPGCPDGTTNTRAVVNNAAAGWNNVTIVGNTTQGVSTTSDFDVPFTDTFSGTAQRNGLTISPGNYVVSLICQNRLGQIQFGQFDGTITFTSPTTYTSQAPAQDTTTTVTASPGSPSQQGTPVTFTASVSPSAAGTVQFKDGTTNLGSPVTVNNGQAASAPQTLSTGSHSITGVFTPASPAAFNGSTSAPLSYSVTAAPQPAQNTTTTLTASPGSPSQQGTPVTFTASVSPSAAGTVQFKDGTTNLGSPVTVNNGQAASAPQTLSTGSHSITGVFTPASPAAFNGSTSAPLSYSVTAAPQPAQNTTTTLTASPGSPSQQGTPVTFTASVSPSAAGTVQFKDGTTNLGSPVTVNNGQAASAPQTLSTGSHSITGVFTPASPAAFNGSTSAPLSYSVTAAPQPAQNTTTTLTASPGSPSQQGTPVTFTASVSPSAAGTVQFKDGTTNLGSPVTVSNGQAASAPQTLSTGSHSITGVFTPASPAAFNGSTSAPLSYSVTAAPQPAQNTTTTLTASPGSPSQQGTPVTFKATVSPSAAGTVQFKDGTTNLGSPVTVSNGQASSAPQTLSTGSHSITGVFTPASPAAFNGSTSAPLSYSVTAAPAPAQKPVVTHSAHVSGTPKVSNVVSCEATFTGATSLSYVWTRDGRVIPKATNKTYKLTGKDRYTKVSCTVTARNAAGTTSSTAPAVFVRNGIKCYWTPSVLSWGHSTKLFAFQGIYGPAPSSTSVQWYRDGKAIAGDTNVVHKIVAADRGRVLAFTVTVRAPQELDRVVHSHDRRISR